MRNYLEDWLSEEENVVVPAPAQSVSRQRRTKQGEEAEGGSSAGQTSGKQIENDGARMVWTEQREAGGWNGWFWEKNGGKWFRWLCPAGRSGRRQWNIWTGRCSGMRGGMTVGFRCIKRFDL